MTITKEERRTLKQNNNVVLDKHGVDAWGFYAAFASKWSETRVFAAGRVVCIYSRPFTNSRTTWRLEVKENETFALQAIEKLTSFNALVGAPILVQLTDSDVELVRARKMPNARYRGQARHEALYGKTVNAAVTNVNVLVDWTKIIELDQKRRTVLISEDGTVAGHIPAGTTIYTVPAPSTSSSHSHSISTGWVVTPAASPVGDEPF